MAGVVLFICLSGLTFSPNIKSDNAENALLEVETRTSSAEAGVQKNQSGLEGAVKTVGGRGEERLLCVYYCV